MKKGNLSDAAIINQKVKMSVKKRPLKTVSQLSEAEALKLIQTLEVHKMELEIQNEELLQARSSAAEAAKKYTELYDFAPSGYFTLSGEGGIIELNHCGSQMLGREKSQLINTRFDLSVSTDSKPVFNLFLEKVFNGKFKESCELVLDSDENMPLCVHITGRVTENGDQCFVTVVDITERKKAEEEVYNLNSELEQRVISRTEQLEAINNELEAFSYSVSHDLRAPLRHITGFTDILRNEYYAYLPEEAKNYLDTISGSVHKMGTLINDLLKFSKIGRAEMSKKPLIMNKVVEDALAQIHPFNTDRKVDWNISTLPEVIGDYNLLRQVWVNLLDNALKFSGKRNKSVISVGYKEEYKEVVFYIKDNGVGFNMKYSYKLFGVFQRLHSSTQFDGTGVGLANVRRIISRHGGRIWAESEEDKGATFYFSMPKFTN